ncbi:MAG: DUF4132 domain-containing protein [Oscillospiraceae bacterium]|nr:DUF4132 domain-containing protein [Oscillospiraceae bacterium]
MDTEELKYFMQELIGKAKSEDAENEAAAGAATAGLDEDKKAFLDDLENLRNKEYCKSSIIRELAEGLKTQKIKKPSDFIKKKLGWFLGDDVPERVKEYLFYNVDNCIKWQYAWGWNRRSFRTARYDVHFSHIIDTLRNYRRHHGMNKKITAVLSGTIPKDTEKFISGLEAYYDSDSSPIAYELDHGNTKLEKKITDIIMGESDSELGVSYDLIRGIVKSSNVKMHGLLGKLLLAARLQEGVRQAVCESADHGTAEAFTLLLRVITDNNLIRFSSVKRAVGTWTGLMTEESSDLERISGKTVELMTECIDSEEKRRKYLDSEDCMKIYMALWAECFFEADNAKSIIGKIMEKGTHHQLLAAGYLIPNLQDGIFMCDVSKEVLKRHYMEKDIAAVYMYGFMLNCSSNTDNVNSKNGFARYVGSFPKSAKRLPYEGGEFKDKKEAEEYYGILKKIKDNIKGKSIEIFPCIFPWYSVKLDKSSVAEKMACIASYLEDDGKIDEICGILNEIDPGGRNGIIPLLLCEPRTEIQRRTLIASLCDKGEFPRRAAFAAVGCVDLVPEDYIQMEELLKYKAADARANIISLLMRQPDEALYGSVCRLLGDKKEEKRTAALDMILQISKDENRSGLFEKCRSLAMSAQNYSTKEKVLLDSILAAGGQAENTDAPEPLFSEEDAYKPVLPEGDYMRECSELFMEYFPDSEIGSVLYPEKFKKPAKKKTDCAAYLQAADDNESLNRLMIAHREREFVNNGTAYTLDCPSYAFYTVDENGKRAVPFMDDWRKWAQERKLDEKRLMRALIASAYSGGSENELAKRAEKYIIGAYGRGFEKYVKPEYEFHLNTILAELMKDYPNCIENCRRLAFAMMMWYLKVSDDEDKKPVKWTEPDRYAPSIAHIVGHAKLYKVINWSGGLQSEHSKERMALEYIFFQKCGAKLGYYDTKQIITPGERGINPPGVIEFTQAAYYGEISERTLYWYIFGDSSLDARSDKEIPVNLIPALDKLSKITSVYMEQGKQRSMTRGYRQYSQRYAVTLANEFAEKSSDETSPYTEEETGRLRFAARVYGEILNVVLYHELRRGDSNALYSKAVRHIGRISGVKNFAAILCALGKDTLERSSYASGTSKKTNLSHLLSVCVPDKDDNADSLRELIKGTDITEKRLIEAALYSPEWLDIVAEYLGWEGFTSACWYFMAHMNESFDETRKAIIAKYTPLTADELNAGAFDIGWFRSAYETIGEKRFDIIYDCAKYISDGSKHSRARKYADAVMGKLDTAETKNTVADKRNKDLLMAYALIPIKDEDDLFERYLYLQQFLKESKKFGSQRSASEKKAVEIAMQNLSINAGFSDVTRLTLKMETKLTSDSKELFEEKQLDDVTVRLFTDESGKTEIICAKGGKLLKSIPAKLKKNEYILTLTETKKRLTDQYRRTRLMFEQAMEDRVEFTVGEIKMLRENPVVLPIIRNLVFEVKGKIGFLEGNKLRDYTGKASKAADSDKVTAAHPFALYSSGHWADYQKYLFDNKLVQPFKQVFRELYVKTAEEADMLHSLRYAGNQIQPAKTVACLKSRRWVADVENGLQKIYYKENIVAEIFARADWFTPADIEAPTLEWVCFSDRNTGKAIAIKDIPDVIFSEVMRDVDLAVSVAHAGGVDPETSHSTIEMRAAILGFTLPLFGLSNVKIKGSHAHIDGKLASYTVHLGSGVIHKRGGAMIAVLPVHSQQRGRLFLPFADDDPKTAEIISKVLFLAEDSKIKDPSILEQIKR